MSQKREEYCDPDYSQFQPVRSQVENVAKKSPDPKSDGKAKSTETRIEAIRRIVDREFKNELTSKEHELEEINKRLEESKKLLAKVRYAVVYHYYNQKNLICSAEEVAAVEKSQQECMTSYPPPGDKPQMAIHPSLKKLLGKRPIDYNEILKTRPARRAAKNATEQFQKMVKKPTDTKIKMRDLAGNVTTESCHDAESKKPRYVAPTTSNTTIPQVNSARGRNNYRHILVVGNVSKYIGDEEAELATNVTHKWLIYVSTKSAVPVEQIVSRARFFLHESYKPNDIIEVGAPPFQISKRGWGEFPVRVQLYFHPHLMQKPLQIFHTLILDKKHTGMQTMGAETIVEVWLNIPNTVTDEAQPSTSYDSSSKQSNVTNDSSSVKVAPPRHNSPIEPSKSNVTPCNSSKQSPYNSLQSLPSTSAQAMARPVLPKLVQPEPVIKQEVITKEEPMEIVENQKNGQKPPHLTPIIKIKTEQPSLPLELAPSVPLLRICDQNKLKTNPPQNIGTMVKPNTKKTYMKCVGKDGKVSLMELVQDEKNPKLFKMVLPHGVQANNFKMVPQGRVGTPVVLPSNSIRPINVIGQSPKVGTPLIRTLSAPISLANISINSPAKLVPTIVNNQNTPNQMVNRRISIGNITSPLKTMPKLVAINSPRPSTSRFIPSPKINVVPTQNITSIPTSSPNKTSTTSLIHKNNKVLILDTNRMSKTQQQSLLKPQVSLLKPRPMPMNSALKKITVSNISGLENKNINVFLPADMKFDINAQTKSQAERQRYGAELEQRFIARKSFTNMTDAIGWLLKEIQLISPLAAQSEFKEAFPFTVKSTADFHSLLIAKQRSFEWLRAKHISRLVQKHDSLRNFKKWCTKDIVLFGRWFGYTPPSVFNFQKASIKKENDQNVREIVKTELIREQLQNDTISFNKKLTKWIEEVEETSKNVKESIDEQIIIVDDENEDQPQKESSPLKADENFMHLPLQCGHDELMWINEEFRKMQIRVGEEEIVEGVLHRSAELVFTIALRSFLEDLLRKCNGNKQRTINSESSYIEINNDDVLRTISSTRYQHFDFLTNKHFGIEKSNPSK